MTDSRSSSFTSWVLWRVYGALTVVVALLVIASFLLESLVNTSTVYFIAGFWLVVTVLALASWGIGDSTHEV